MPNKNPQLNQLNQPAPDTSAVGTVSNTPMPKPAPKDQNVAPGADVGQDQVQATVDEEVEKGYRGTTQDDGDYTVAGSLAGENNPDAGKGDPNAVTVEP